MIDKDRIEQEANKYRKELFEQKIMVTGHGDGFIRGATWAIGEMTAELEANQKKFESDGSHIKKRLGTKNKIK